MPPARSHRELARELAAAGPQGRQRTAYRRRRVPGLCRTLGRLVQARRSLGRTRRQGADGGRVRVRNRGAAVPLQDSRPSLRERRLSACRRPPEALGRDRGQGARLVRLVGRVRPLSGRDRAREREVTPARSAERASERAARAVGTSSRNGVRIARSLDERFLEAESRQGRGSTNH